MPRSRSSRHLTLVLYQRLWSFLADGITGYCNSQAEDYDTPSEIIPAQRWSTVDYYMRGGMGDIKALSVQDYDRLMVTAAERSWSATGRPEWLARERDNIRELMLVAINVEQPSVYRCMVTAILKDGSGRRFTLDVGFSDFRRLCDISFDVLVTLAHRYLASFPMLELDPRQKETWTRPKGHE